MSQYFFTGPDNREYGPFPREQLLQWIAEQRIQAATGVRGENEQHWQAAGQHPDFAGAFQQANAGPRAPLHIAAQHQAAPPPPSSPPQPQQRPHPPMQQALQTQVRHSTWLTTSFILNSCCCGPAALPAFYHATKADTLLKRGDHEEGARHAHKARRWCIFGIVLWVIFILLSLLLGKGNKDSPQSLSNQIDMLMKMLSGGALSSAEPTPGNDATAPQGSGSPVSQNLNKLLQEKLSEAILEKVKEDALPAGTTMTVTTQDMGLSEEAQAAPAPQPAPAPAPAPQKVPAPTLPQKTPPASTLPPANPASRGVKRMPAQEAPRQPAPQQKQQPKPPAAKPKPPAPAPQPGQ